MTREKAKSEIRRIIRDIVEKSKELRQVEMFMSVKESEANREENRPARAKVLEAVNYCKREIDRDGGDIERFTVEIENRIESDQHIIRENNKALLLMNQDLTIDRDKWKGEAESGLTELENQLKEIKADRSSRKESRVKGFDEVLSRYLYYAERRHEMGEEGIYKMEEFKQELHKFVRG